MFVSIKACTSWIYIDKNIFWQWANEGDAQKKILMPLFIECNWHKSKKGSKKDENFFFNIPFNSVRL